MIPDSQEHWQALAEDFRRANALMIEHVDELRKEKAELVALVQAAHNLLAEQFPPAVGHKTNTTTATV